LALGLITFAVLAWQLHALAPEEQQRVRALWLRISRKK